MNLTRQIKFQDVQRFFRKRLNLDIFSYPQDLYLVRGCNADTASLQVSFYEWLDSENNRYFTYSDDPLADVCDISIDCGLSLNQVFREYPEIKAVLKRQGIL